MLAAAAAAIDPVAVAPTTLAPAASLKLPHCAAGSDFDGATFQTLEADNTTILQVSRRSHTMPLRVALPPLGDAVDDAKLEGRARRGQCDAGLGDASLLGSVGEDGLRANRSTAQGVSCGAAARRSHAALFALRFNWVKLRMTRAARRRQLHLQDDVLRANRVNRCLHRGFCLRCRSTRSGRGMRWSSCRTNGELTTIRGDQGHSAGG